MIKFGKPHKDFADATTSLVPAFDGGAHIADLMFRRGSDGEVRSAGFRPRAAIPVGVALDAEAARCLKDHRGIIEELLPNRAR